MSEQPPRISRAPGSGNGAANGATGRLNGRNGHRPYSPIVPRHAWYVPCKTAVEFLVAAVLLVLALPFIVFGVIAVKLTSRGPACYRQTRVGRGGRKFTLIKLRTMIHDAEAETGPVWTRQDDPRITRVGKFLRDTHIDEFPQIINVLLGHMSLVGPRPERPEFVSHLEWQLPNYRDRLNLRPGITGIAQLNLPPDTDLESVRHKLLHDLYYVRHSNPWLDLRILCSTGWLWTRTMLLEFWRLIALPSPERVKSRVECIVNSDSELLAGSSE